MPFGLTPADLTPTVLYGLGFLFLMLGWLVPYRTHREKKEEAERWRLAYEKERDARAKSDSQTIELLEFAKTDHSLIVALFEASERAKLPGGTNVVSTQGK